MNRFTVIKIFLPDLVLDLIHGITSPPCLARLASEREGVSTSRDRERMIDPCGSEPVPASLLEVTRDPTRFSCDLLQQDVLPRLLHNGERKGQITC